MALKNVNRFRTRLIRAVQKRGREGESNSLAHVPGPKFKAQWLRIRSSHSVLRLGLRSFSPLLTDISIGLLISTDLHDRFAFSLSPFLFPLDLSIYTVFYTTRQQPERGSHSFQPHHHQHRLASTGGHEGDRMAHARQRSGSVNRRAQVSCLLSLPLCVGWGLMSGCGSWRTRTRSWGRS